MHYSNRPKRLTNEGLKQTAFNNRVTQAHQELQQFFAKFDDCTPKKDKGREKIYNHVKPKDPFDDIFSNHSELESGNFGGIDDIFDRPGSKDELNKPSQARKLTKEDLDQLAQSKLAEYQIIRLLGQGAYAQVKLAQHKETKQRVAIKIYPKFKLNDSSKRKAVEREITCMQQLKHPNICKLYDSFESSKEIFLVQEYVSGISLYQYMRNKGNKALSLDTAKVFIKQLVECIKYMHS